MMQEGGAAIKLYGTSWCPDSLRAKRLLEREGIPFQYIDIDESREGEDLVRQTNHGNRSVPTIVFPDGAVFVEPGGPQLRAKIVELRERGLIVHEPSPKRAT